MAFRRVKSGSVLGMGSSGGSSNGSGRSNSDMHTRKLSFLGFGKVSKNQKLYKKKKIKVYMLFDPMI